MLREAMQIGLVKELVWTDTRDMVCDGMTKGAVDLAALLQLMQGKLA